MNEIVAEYEDIQTLMLMSDFFGENYTCTALQTVLVSMNKGLWELGIKIDQYRQVTEEFMKDPFYLEQKKEFNRKEILYFSMMKKMKEMCGINQTIITYFYRKKEECPDCDAQSFVLSDIKRDLENMGKDEEIAIFSFDSNLDLPAINMLLVYYNVTEFPCMIIDDEKHCGLYNKNNLEKILCDENSLSICE
ncbi:hypothetical protein GF323_04660 [Candidatus Woesearchaeota archaeon]|nr:hypothetical protein [Candidatus Woesearchaeota archaeon]